MSFPSLKNRDITSPQEYISPWGRGNICMLGGIYSDQRCRICGSRFRDNGKTGLFCPNHPKERADSRFIVNFQDVWKRFKSYDEASRFLNGLRYKTDEGTFDSRDYKKDEPLGFANLTEKWLTVKKQEVKSKSYNNLKNYISRAQGAWANKNIKLIGYAEIEDFLLAQDVSSKTRANIRSCLHDFWIWLRKRRVLRPDQFPEFPEVSFELGYRKIIDRVTQERILAEVYRISHDTNIKVWLGIKWLMTYVKVRPGELVKLLEGDIDLEMRCFFIPHPKEKKPKWVPLIDEDIEILQSIPRGFPKLPFFRHASGVSGVQPGEPFGEKY